MDTLLKYGLIACFFSLILTPLGLPIPEELSLLAAGVVVKKNTTPIALGWIVGFVGVTLGDVIAWSMGRHVGLEPKGFVSRLVGKEQIKDIEKFYRKWGDWAIVIARQIPGMRLPTFFFAGASAIPFGRFYLIDGLAALVTVNVYFFLGYTFADDLGKVQVWINEFRFYASSLAFLFFALLISYVIRKRVSNRKKNNPTP